MPQIKITETVLRDAHQSLIATRMTTEDMIPMLADLDKVGFHSLECWGGATFDACLRFLGEDPWERLRTIRKACPNTKLQMLFRGQNMLGYRHYSINAAKKYGGHVQGCISYTTGPVFTLDYYTKYAKTLENVGADSICIKDMAGLLTPYGTYDLVKALKETVKIPIQLHTHYTSGLASMSLLKGIEAGVDVVDTAMSPLALGTSHPATESMVAALQGTEYDTGLDLNLLAKIRDYVETLRQKYLESGLMNPKVLEVDSKTLLYQVPGGMLSNLVSQLKEAGQLDKLPDVLNEVPRVREDAGYPPLVTPTSQIVGTQAVLNVICGERYKMTSNEFKGLVQGTYGRTPVAIDPAFRKKIIGDSKPIDCRPADLLEPELDKLRGEMTEYLEQEEDVLSYACFGQVATKFFKKRRDEKYGIDSAHADLKAKVHPV